MTQTTMPWRAPARGRALPLAVTVVALTMTVVMVMMPAVLAAQTTSASPAISAAMDRAIARAREAVDNGQGADARAVLDSLVMSAAPGSNDLAEALFWRATLAERVSDAERDWKRLVVEIPLAARASDALMRLGELEMLRGHPADARVYFARVAREYPSGMGKARSQLWMAKSWAAERDLSRACAALAEAVATGVPEGELRLQADELGRQCATVDTRRSAAAAPSPTPSPATPASNTSTSTSTTARPANARYSVQLAAFDTRDEAERLVKRLATRNIEARVDGDVKPFRVRTGYYVTRAEAAAVLAKLKKSGQDGFVAEIAK